MVKSPHSNPFLAWFGRSAIQREARIYQQLEGVPGVPASHGLANRDHLVLECIDGPTLRIAALELADRESFYSRLKNTVEAMHAAGVAHSDLKRKENILVGPNETPFVIDFGIAVSRTDTGKLKFGPGFRTASQMDWNAWIKLKHGRQPQSLPPEDADLYQPLLVERWARKARTPWKVLTLRKMRKRRRLPKN